MIRRFLSYCIPRLCFLLATGTALSLIALVYGAPIVHNGAITAGRWSNVMLVFAEDSTLRRTAVASAIGLFVTALVFFRAPGLPRRRLKERQGASTQNMAGA
jgi:hypothetical protein